MYTKDLSLTQAEVHKLLAAGSGEAALVYLYLQCGNELRDVEAELGATRYASGAAVLKQLGLWPQEPARLTPVQQPPSYTEEDVLSAMNRTADFPLLVGEVQRILGRILTTEELKIFLSFRNYLGLPAEVVSMLVCYCKDRLQRRGSNRNPSLRTIEKEAYIWSERGITTLEEAAAYMQTQNARQARMNNLMQLLQISFRDLTPAEERYAQSWLDMEFDREALQMAYEKTCLNTGGLKWAYMNKILLSWHKQGLRTGAQVKSGDRKPASAAARTAQAQTQRVQAGTAALGEFEREAIARMLREHQAGLNENQEG